MIDQEREDATIYWICELPWIVSETNLSTKKEIYYIFIGVIDQEREDATICWICENDFSGKDQVVLDHFHYINKFLGWAHNECNVNKKTTNYIPVVACNLSIYDLHFIFKTLAKKTIRKTFFP